MQNGLAASIDHGKHGRSLEDLVAYNPTVEEDYNFALQELRAVDFPLLAKLKSQKDASVETIMNLLRLEGPLADAPGMSDLQPDVKCFPFQSAAGTSDSVPTAAATTTTLSTIVISASSALSTTIDDYEIIGADGEEDAQGKTEGGVASISMLEFEKEELDTTP
ncbi:hypothetical protein Tco_1333147 [Tanacetum coccineum]